MRYPNRTYAPARPHRDEDDATGAIYSAFLADEEGTASTFRALQEVFSEHGLPMSLYTDRGAHYFHTPKAGGEVDRGHPTQVGRTIDQLGIEHIGAYSPKARGRSERAFATLQDRLINELALAGLTDIAAANAFIGEVYLPLTTPASPSRRPAKAPPSRPFLASISTRSYGSRRSARSAMTIASPTGGSSSRSRKARCGRICQGAGQDPRLRRRLARPLPRAALHRPLRREGNDQRCKERRLNPLGGQHCGRHGQASGLPPRPQQNKSRRSGQLN